jgi:hypothetical protein
MIKLFLILCAWEKTYGGGFSDGGYCVKQTSDLGYIITGYTYSFGNGYGDLYLLKTDSLGNLEWSKTFGGDLEDVGFCVENTGDGYVVVGSTYSYGVSEDLYFIKVDLSGNLIWQKIYGDANYAQCGYEIEKTVDGGYIITGYWSKYIYLLKTDVYGNMEWEKRYSVYGENRGYSVEETSDNGYIIAGYTHSPAYLITDICVIKTNSVGEIKWLRLFGGEGKEIGYCVEETHDKCYVIVGYTNSYGSGGYDIYFIKVDTLGNLLWEKTYGGGMNEFGYSVKETYDKGFIIAGVKELGNAGYKNIYVLKTDSLGNVLWEKTFGGQFDDYGYWIENVSEKGYVITGYTNSYGSGEYDVYLIKEETGIKEKGNFKDFSFLTISNMFKDKIILKTGFTSEKNVFIVLYNLAGIPVFKSFYFFKAPVTIISDKKIENLPQGIYFLSIYFDKGNFKRIKMIKTY